MSLLTRKDSPLSEFLRRGEHVSEGSHQLRVTEPVADARLASERGETFC
jgi:hypothetical protein